MSDSEDSNFSEEEDSERSSDGEEAEVCVWVAGGAIAPGDWTWAERPLWEYRATQKGLGLLGASRLSRKREKAAGQSKEEGQIVEDGMHQIW